MHEVGSTTWDERGVPTVTAASDVEACAGFGHAQAVAHAREVLELYGVARGRAAELWGADFVAGDVQHALLDLDRHAEAWMAAQEPETMARLAAFCEGFNAACDEDADRGGDRRDALPVAPRDVVAHVLGVFVVFARFWDDGLAFEPTPGGLLGGGSNAWAVAADRSATGEAMLVVNPHIPWMGPFRLFEARTVSPGRVCHGVTPIGFPWQSFGYTPRVGWTQTVNPLPQLWVYTLEGDDDHYRHDGADLAYEQRRHVVGVRDGAPVEVVARRTVHGPVLTAPDGVRVAVRIAGVLEQPAATCLETWWQMSLAADVHELLAATERRPLPMFNVLAADEAGSVLAAYRGVTPHRPGGSFEDHRRRLPGDDPAQVWGEVVDQSDLPSVVDPECGWVQNVNETPWWFCEPPLDPARHPDGIAPDVDRLRDVRSPVSRERLRGLEQVSAEDLLALKWETRVRLADVVVDDLLAAVDPTRPGGRAAGLEEAAAVLRAWDRRADPCSAGYPLFHLWAHEHLSLAGLLIDDAELLGSTTPGGMPRGLTDPDAAVTSLGRAVDVLAGRDLPLGVTWGELASLGVADGVDVPASGAPSYLGALKCLEVTPTPAGWVGIGGDTWVSLVRFTSGGPTASALLVAGNATEPGAPAGYSQLPLFAGDRLVPLPPLPPLPPAPRR